MTGRHRPLRRAARRLAENVVRSAAVFTMQVVDGVTPSVQHAIHLASEALHRARHGRRNVATPRPMSPTTLALLRAEAAIATAEPYDMARKLHVPPHMVQHGLEGPGDEPFPGGLRT